MLPLILAFIISQSASDTILVKGIRGITCRALVNQDTLYFQYKTGHKWSDPMVIDNGDVGSPSMAISSGNYLHIVWCKQGKIYYRTTLEPITKNSIKQNLNPQWSWKMGISTVNPYTEPASNPIVNIQGDKIFVTWQGPNESDSQADEKWERWKYACSDAFWETPPVNKNEDRKDDFNYQAISPVKIINQDEYQLKRIVFLEPGIYYGHHLVCGDTDHDSLNELIFNMDSYTYLQVWEYRPTNRYELVWFAVGGQPPPPGGILVGNFAPNDIGDIDRDSLADLVGPNQEWVYREKTTSYGIVSTQESPNLTSYPESLSWYQRISDVYQSPPSYFTDLDGDSAREILTWNDSGIAIFENVANNQNSLVWNRFSYGSYFAFDDFDLDGRKEFVTASAGSMGYVFLFENTGPDSYELVYQDTVRRPNGSDVFSGKDLDGDRKPEFFVSFAQYVGSRSADIYLYMWETIGNNSYERTLLDVVRRNNFTFAGRWSRCGDLDGDGIEELVWSTQTHISIYKATGNNQFQRFWEWQIDHAAGGSDVAKVNIYDMNNNGYNEIIVSGSGKISIFEIEAVRLLNPNGGQNFLPGDIVLIQWQKFTPPRCDSFSLAYTTDNGQTYLPILNSIPSTESTYNWIVPNTPSESCRVKVTAYGPGTQFDESDALFTIQPSGLAETQVVDQPLRLEIKPNPFKTKALIRLNKPAQKPIAFKIYNSSGILVKTLTIIPEQSTVIWNSRDNSGKPLPSGVYILQCDSKELKVTQKLVIEK